MSTHTLTFTLHGHGDAALYPPLPLLIVDVNHEVVRRLTISPTMPCIETFEIGDFELFAVLRLPNGRSVVKPTEVNGVVQTLIEFEVGTESPHEWMAWSTMRVDLRHDVAPLMDAPGMSRAWMQLWELDAQERRWVQVPLTGQQVLHDDEGVQVELSPLLRPGALLVQLGGGTPQVIALPARTRLMVLLTRAHASGLNDAPRILVGGYGGVAEGMLEFMRAGSLGLASATLDPGSQFANLLLQEKIGDPIAATAAAYYLLRKRDWERLPQDWLVNLAQWFSEIPDATLLRDTSLIQRGMDARQAPALAARCLKMAFAQGLPLFAEAGALLDELFFYADKAEGEDRLTPAQRKLIRAMLAALQPAGLTFGFFGLAPDQPVAAYEAQRALRAITLERRLRALGSEVFDAGALVGLMKPGALLEASRGIDLAVKTIGAAIDVFGGGQLTAPGDPKQTLFVRDVYGPIVSLAQPQAQLLVRRPADPYAGQRGSASQ